MGRLFVPGIILLFFCPPVFAHDGLHRESLRALLKADGLYLVLLYSRDSGERARWERQQADGNGDGHLDRNEREAWLKKLEASVLQRLSLELDDALLVPSVQHRSATGLSGPSRSQGAITASLQVRWSFGRAKTHRLILRMTPNNLAGHVPLFLQVDSGLRLAEHSGRVVKGAGGVRLEELLRAKTAARMTFVLAPAEQAPEKHL